MPEQKNMVIPFDDKARVVLSTIIEKYKLQEDEETAFKKLAEKKSLNQTVMIKLTRDLMTEKISNKEFLDALHENFKTEKEVTKNIALDIINNLIPILEKIPEDKLQENNRTKQLKESALKQKEEAAQAEKEAKELKEKTAKTASEKTAEQQTEEEKKEAFRKAKEELMKKIGAKKTTEPAPTAPTSNSGAVKPTTTNVEENAKKITQERKPMVSGKEEVVKPQAPPPPAPPKNSDGYRESVE